MVSDERRTSVIAPIVASAKDKAWSAEAWTNSTVVSGKLRRSGWTSSPSRVAVCAISSARPGPARIQYSHQTAAPPLTSGSANKA